MESFYDYDEEKIVEETLHQPFLQWKVNEYANDCQEQCRIAMYEEFTILSQNASNNILIKNNDIIGAQILNQETDLCKIEISVMPVIDTKENIREFYTYTYWVNSLKKATNIVGAFIDISLGNQVKDEYKTLPDKTKHLLILINPFSCNGQAVKNWNKAFPMLSKFHLEFKVLTTEYAGHAKDICAKQDISMFSAVVTISGDGLIHEVVNGLMQREDELESLPLLGFLPGGTSDGLVKSVLSECGEGFSLTNAVFVVGKGSEKKIDLFKIKRDMADSSIYSFLGVSWAICADIDLESEVIRFIGSLRYNLWAFWRIISLREYNVTFKVTDEEGIKTIYENKEIYWLFLHNLAFPDSKMHLMPICKSDDGLGYMTIMDSNISRKSMLYTLITIEDSPFFKKLESNSPHGRPSYEEDHENYHFDLYKGKEFSIEPDDELIERVRNPNNDIHYGKFSIDGEPYPIDKYSKM